MVKIGMLLPEADMVPMAENVVKDMNVEIACLKAISSVDVVNEARLAVRGGGEDCDRPRLSGEDDQAVYQYSADRDEAACTGDRASLTESKTDGEKRASGDRSDRI